MSTLDDLRETTLPEADLEMIFFREGGSPGGLPLSFFLRSLLLSIAGRSKFSGGGGLEGGAIYRKHAYLSNLLWRSNNTYSAFEGVMTPIRPLYTPASSM